MSIPPPIIVSSLDYERLFRLLSTCEHGHPVAPGLEAELERADIFEPPAMPPDVVTMNSTARVQLAGEEPKLLTLVYPRDADGAQNRISVLAPIGAALLGLSAGQRIEWPTPAGMATLKVLEVTRQPEACGDLHR